MSEHTESDADGKIRRRTGGRSAKIREAVLRGTIEALADVGPAGLNFSEIARRSEVHATSIQRRWGSCENVLLEALLAASEERVLVPNRGSLRDDLIGLARSLAAYITSPLGEGVVRMMAASHDDPALAANRAAFFGRRFEAARIILERADDRGELREGTDPDLAIELLGGVLYLRLLVTRQTIDDALIVQVVDTLLRGIARSDA